ncbi:MAG: hypothetical protein H7836_04465 [Magnetococcus sp. YQC-3]
MEKAITQEQLEQILKGYEKIGAVDNQIAKLDTVFRKFISETIDLARSQLKNELDIKINSLVQKFDTTIKNAIDSAKANNFKEVVELCKVQIEAQSRNILSENLKLIEKKSNDIRNNTEQSISQKLLISEKEVESSISNVKRDMYAQIVNFEKYVENLCVVSMQKAIDTHKGAIETLITSELSAQYQSFKEQLSQIHYEIMKELENKIIDKKLIDDRLASIEKDLLAKTQGVINFQLDQSRAMMEQSARAEISESLKLASKEMLTSLL